MSRPKPKEMDLTVGNPFWSLLKFAIPVILGNLFQLFGSFNSRYIIIIIGSMDHLLTL